MAEGKKMAEMDILEGIKTKTVTISKQEQQKPKPSLPKDEIILTISTDNGFLSKPLSLCSDEEFLTWIKGVYPLVTTPASNFSTQQARMNAFVSILKYHEQFLTSEQRETVH